MKKAFLAAAALLICSLSFAANEIRLDSVDGHDGTQKWEMCRVGDNRWMPAIVPGTVLNSLVYNKVLPEPYYGMNNKIESNLIPEIAKVGRDYYTYWFRTEVDLPADYAGQQIWLHPEGVNYRAEFWFNDHLVSTVTGMFRDDHINVTAYAKPGEKNVLAVKVYPVDEPGTTLPKSWGAVGEFFNGGNGDIGLNTTMLMSVGWDFTFMDGIRDRNTGIWKSISFYTTGPVALRNPFIKSALDKPSYNVARETITVEVENPILKSLPIDGYVEAEIVGEGIKVRKNFTALRGTLEKVTFSPEEFKELVIANPRLWWPVNKGPQNMYDLKLTAYVGGVESHSVSTRFGIREIVSDQNTPDNSRVFYVNGKRLFIHGTNWIPEAMQRTDDARMEAELRYTRQCGVNLIREWGGGIAESDRFFELCDEYGILVWQEFWMSGDSRHPHDRGVYFSNVASTVQRIRNHPSLAYYVASNESTEMSGMREFIMQMDGTRGYQMQSECDGVHDGSPYKQVNPMQHYENTASDRGSRIDGFNPEYGAPTIPLPESLHMMMDDKDLWPMNKEVWDYHDGNGFHLMSTVYTDMTNCYGPSNNIEEFAAKGQLVGAMNSKSIWEVWNENKLDYGDRFCSGLLFWYHNNPVPQVCGRMWDWYLEPTASLYHTMHALEPIHIQFDYLKNTVSVNNEYYQSFSGYKATAQIYDMNSRKLYEKTVSVDLPEDGVANDIIKLEFPADITPVHFVNLILKDAAGKVVSTNFYWRSTDEYKGKPSLTGPTTAGFESLKNMKVVDPKVKLTSEVRDGKTFFTVNLRNPGSKISFFNRLQLLDAAGKPVRPAFYSDNFFTLMPGESKTVTIEAPGTEKYTVKSGSVLNMFK